MMMPTAPALFTAPDPTPPLARLGAFHVKSELYEKAMPYFDLASKIQPQEVKWLLMVASCHRRIGASKRCHGHKLLG
jgi:hypothetical protein